MVGRTGLMKYILYFTLALQDVGYFKNAGAHFLIGRQAFKIAPGDFVEPT